MKAGIIYYTDNRLDNSIAPIVREQMLKANLPIVSCSLKPIDFGQNIVLNDRERSYPTMVEQILTALEVSTADYVFFCEHDVLYHPSHFDFTPSKDDIYYYNSNNYRWLLGSDKAITYDRLISLSALCVNRRLAIEHYRLRSDLIRKFELAKIEGKEPSWARKMGYEPGTKKIKRGGITDEDFETWRSEYPNIDIRHSQTFSPSKVTLDSFKHKPTNFKEIPISDLPYWNLKELFK